jgi:peptidoglycan-associated lipoprotein
MARKEPKMKRLPLLLWPASLLIAACSTPIAPARPAPAPQAAAPVHPTPSPSLAPARPAPVAKTQSPLEAFQHLEPALDQNSIYFDFDKYAIKPNEDSIIAQHAKVLQTYPRDSLTLQGNCDERGSSEYNLALGQRRADTIKERLVLMGIPATRIETISFGKEKPRETCHQEKCWKENRRADFVDTWKQEQVTSR